MNLKLSLTTLISAGLVTIAWAQPTTLVLQEGLNGYAGCTDKELRDPGKDTYKNGPSEATLKISEY